MKTGRQLNGYTVVREIGRGGMGHVYLAERSDGAFHKQVAIKLVLPSIHTAGITVRFQQEREILASLDHPNIARLLDGGVTEEGWPYFVMEFVDGQPIDRYCDEHKLNISQRIQLFHGVLSAVRYAHQRLVVHRDLKPGNIFVTHDGTVKLLDFGIAKMLSRDSSGEQSNTLTLAQMMTPEYASPEQVNGKPITTLSDVYSLGVILYELLTGHRPYQLLRAAIHEMARVIAEIEPTRPSQIVTTTESNPGRAQLRITPDLVSAVREGDPERLRKRLAGDVDSILLMALHKDPEHRYASAQSFSDDLERHLQHRPITAREASASYRFKRFCMRNPGGVAAGILLLIALLGSGAAVVMQARHDIETAINSSPHSVFLLPVLGFFATFTLVCICAFVVLVRPTSTTLLASAAGGMVWGVAILGKWRLEHDLGWWRSRVPGSADPLMVMAPATYFLYWFIAVLLLLLAWAVGRRFGWKGQALALIGFGLLQESREHIWYGQIIPAMTFESDPFQLMCGAAMLVAGGALGVIVMRLIVRRDRLSVARTTPSQL